MKAHVKGSGSEAYPDAGGSRIVREWSAWTSYDPVPLHEDYTGAPFLAIPWPTDAPAPWNDPACALREWRHKNGLLVRITGVPVHVGGRGEAWHIAYQHGDRAPTHCYLSALVPVNGPCEHKNKMHHDQYPGSYVTCHDCGEVILDRRKTVRREGERRKIGHKFCGGRRSDTPGSSNRRGATADRRRS